MYFAKDFEEEKTGLISKVGTWDVYWGTTGTLHYIKFEKDGIVSRFNILTGRQIIVDKEYHTIPLNVLTAVNMLSKAKVNGKDYWDIIIMNINTVNDEVPNYLVLKSDYCPRFVLTKKPGPKTKRTTK